MEYAVETVALTKTFADGWGRRKVFAVNDLNLRIRTNEVFGLLGPNGSGKTTTLKMLLGLLHPTKGQAFLLGGDGADPKINSHIGFLPEESYLYKYLNPRETLDFYGRLFGLPRRVRRDRIETLLDMVGLKAVANRQVGTFSKGMARRIGLAQALINDPDLLILDEPTTGLDPIGTRQIKDLIISLAQRGKTVLLCSHLLADVEDVCDRIAILYGGKIQAQGRVRELLQQADKRQITTSQIDNAVIEKIRQLIVGAQADCEISSPMERLETFFVRTVAEAQKQAQPTSGAHSTTDIGGFLAPDRARSDVLADLVTGSASEDAAPLAGSTAQPVAKPDAQEQGVLDQLTDPTSVAPPEAKTTQPVETGQLPSEGGQVNKNILDQLVDPTQADTGTTELTEPTQEGEPGNA